MSQMMISGTSLFTASIPSNPLEASPTTKQSNSAQLIVNIIPFLIICSSSTTKILSMIFFHS